MPRAPRRACPRPYCPHTMPCPTHPTHTGWRTVAMVSNTARGYGTAAWRPIRARVLARDAWTCQTCGQPGNVVDHVIAKARGGTDDEDNLAAICARCHLRKTGRTT